jgi:two-domain glycosyltransferase
VWQPDEGFRLSAARNRAIREATGELIVFVDGDCLLRPDFVEAHQQVAERGFATAGNRVLLGQAVTADIEAGRQNPLDWSCLRWLMAWRRGDVNHALGLLRLPGQWWRRMSGRPWRHFKGCNMALWRDDLVRLNGFEEEIAGWGFEDTDLILRWFNLGGRLKSGRFATTVLHLWHREAARDAAEQNERRARLAGSRGATAAVRGLAQLSEHDHYAPPGGI